MSERAAATPATERIATLDVLRGVALLFIFVVNLPFLAFPSTIALQTPSGGPAGDVVAWGITTGLFTNKSFALFSMLFGMGFVLQMQRAERTSKSTVPLGRPFRALYQRRLALLGLMGLAHGVFLFVGDILFPYAIAGGVLFVCRRWSPKRYLIVAGVLMLFGAALSVGWTLLEDWSPNETTEPEPVWAADENVSWTEVFGTNAVDRPALEHKAYDVGPLATTIRVNAYEYAGWLFISSILSFNWRVMAFFFIGAALMKLDFFAHEREPLHRRLCAIGLAVGLVIEIGLLPLKLADERSSGAAALITGADELGATFLSAGYLGLIVLLVARGILPRVQGWIACTGRMALTNYIGQSVLACLIFRWYGLGWYDERTRMEILLLAAGIYVVQVAFSVAWLSRFRMGPLEWAWRKGTYGKG
ncbi:MAG: DUF418 domain-containing protein [bacterium]|nr:DUF418 domain-containing protein [bacterium]